jgi:hypothetical protein
MASRAGAHVDGAAVREAGAIRRVEAAHRQQFAKVGARITARGPHGIGDQVRHGEHRRPGVEDEPVLVEYASAAAPQLLTFHHSDVVATAREVTRCRKTGQTRPDYDNRVHIRAPIMIMMLTGRFAQLGEGATHHTYTQVVDVGHWGRHGPKL